MVESKLPNMGYAKLNREQIAAIIELNKLGVSGRQISKCLNISRPSVNRWVRRAKQNPDGGIPTRKIGRIYNKISMCSEMQTILKNLVEVNPNITPIGLKSFSNDFESISNKTIQRHIDKTVKSMYGANSVLDIPDMNEGADEIDPFLVEPKCVVKQEKDNDDYLEYHGSISFVDVNVKQEDESEEVMRLEEEVEEIQIQTDETSIRCDILQAQNESLLLDIQDLQEKKFPVELQQIMLQEIKQEKK